MLIDISEKLTPIICKRSNGRLLTLKLHTLDLEIVCLPNHGHQPMTFGTSLASKQRFHIYVSNIPPPPPLEHNDKVPQKSVHGDLTVRDECLTDRGFRVVGLRLSEDGISQTFAVRVLIVSFMRYQWEGETGSGPLLCREKASAISRLQWSLHSSSLAAGLPLSLLSQASARHIYHSKHSARGRFIAIEPAIFILFVFVARTPNTFHNC